MNRTRHIVVGVDGSDCSRVALGWACAEAAHDQARLTVLAVRPPPLPPTGPADGPMTRPVDDEPAVDAQSTLDALLAEAAIPDGVKVTSEVVGGDPAHELIKASEGADLLVVGSRGHGGFYGLLLGSVSQNVSEHAKCTVVVAR